MVSQGYRDWLAAGKPYTLIRPAKAVQTTLQGYGLTVYDYPNDAHLQANTPEDHTPFSVTGWPGANKRWFARGVDVMPRSNSYAHRKENADIARQLIWDKDTGHPGVAWIKYINWTDEAGNCVNVSWKPNKVVKKSTDKGHIHISGRSDVDDDERADDYDPIARMAEGDDDVDPLLAAKIDAVYNALETTKLPGGGDKLFTVPLTAKLNELGAKFDAAVARAAAGGADPAQVAALVVEQLGPLLPTLDDIRKIAKEEARAALDAARLTVS